MRFWHYDYQGSRPHMRARFWAEQDRPGGRVRHEMAPAFQLDDRRHASLCRAWDRRVRAFENGDLRGWTGPEGGP